MNRRRDFEVRFILTWSNKADTNNIQYDTEAAKWNAAMIYFIYYESFLNGTRIYSGSCIYVV